MQEIWHEIKEWPTHYISNQGRVKNNKIFLALCPAKKRRRYVYVYHSDRNIKPRALSVHRLVARYFIPNPENKPHVNHIDNNPENNDILNLEWCTPKENTAHMINQDRKVQYRGSQCTQAKLTEKTVSEILSLRGKLTYNKIAEKYKTNYSNIAHIMRGSRWSHITKPVDKIKHYRSLLID